MTLADMIELGVGNLWRTKLRAVLTITGVVIAIATFVAMLSFGAGNRKYVTDMYTDLGLFTSMTVLPAKEPPENDSIAPPRLNRENVLKLAAIPGVKLAYPYDAFDVTAVVADTQLQVQARALPIAAAETRLFSHLLAGQTFSSDTAREALVTPEFVEQLGIAVADSLVGRELIVSVRVADLDSAVINVVKNKDGSIARRLDEIDFDSIFVATYRTRVLRRELDEGLRRFIDGLFTRQRTVADTLVIRGIAEKAKDYNFRLAPVVIPEMTAHRLSSSGLAIGANPTALLSAMQAGRFFQQPDGRDWRNFPRVTLDLDPYTPVSEVKDSVEALGFRAFSYAEEFKVIQKFFLYFNLGLGVVGLIALVTAALGIVNTMVMSILERRREIGVMKSLGADAINIKAMFLVESAVIGALGATVGILLGWTGTRIASMVFRAIMRHEEMLVFDPFALPFWLILLSFTFGVTVSMLAGLYPAARAARVDPVEALRAE